MLLGRAGVSPGFVPVINPSPPGERTLYVKCPSRKINMAAKIKPYLNIQCDWTEILRQGKQNELFSYLQNTYKFIMLQEFW